MPKKRGIDERLQEAKDKLETLTLEKDIRDLKLKRARRK
jgi:hypothetical protein